MIVCFLLDTVTCLVSGFKNQKTNQTICLPANHMRQAGFGVPLTPAVKAKAWLM